MKKKAAAVNPATATPVGTKVRRARKSDVTEAKADVQPPTPPVVVDDLEVPPSEGKQPEPKVETFMSCSPEAWKWGMDKNSIPGAKSPILYSGRKLLETIASELGRPIELPEFQMLVQADGGMETCSVEGVQIQPVKFVVSVPKNLRERLERGETLEECVIFGGQFTLNKARDGYNVYGGSVFYLVRDNSDRKRGLVPKFNAGSNLFLAYKTNHEWPVPRKDVDRVIQKIQEKSARIAKIQELSEDFSPTRSKNRRFRNDAMRHAFDHPEHRGGRNRRNHEQLEAAEG